MTDELPQGWEWATLGDVAENHDGRRIPVKAADRVDMQGEYPYYGASGVIDHVNDYIFDGTFLLISEDGANLLSRTKPIAFEATGRFWVNNHAHVLSANPGVVHQRFLMYAVENSDLRDLITGSAQPKITQRNLAKIAVPLPPLWEQERIVSAVEESFSRLDAAEASLGGAARRLQVLVGAALDKSATGDPVAVEELLLRSNYGTSAKCDYYAAGPPVLRIPNIKSRRVSMSDLKFASSAEEVGEAAYVDDGDVLVVRTNGSRGLIGRTAVVRSPDTPLAFASYLIRLQFDSRRVLPEFASMMLESPQLRHEIELRAASSAGQYNLSLAKIKPLKMPLPALPEQLELVHQFRRLEDQARRVDVTLGTARMHSIALRRRTLSAALSGRLTGNTSSDGRWAPGGRATKMSCPQREATHS